jgi:hypothetical protein
MQKSRVRVECQRMEDKMNGSNARVFLLTLVSIAIFAIHDGGS